MTGKERIDSLDTAKITCPQCSGTRVIQVSRHEFIHRETSVRFNCSCGYTFKSILVKKNLQKHRLNLIGTYMVLTPPKIRGKLTVKEVNNTGVIVVLGGRGNITQGARLLLEFVLDDGKQSIVKKMVLVKNYISERLLRVVWVLAWIQKWESAVLKNLTTWPSSVRSVFIEPNGIEMPITITLSF